MAKKIHDVVSVAESNKSKPMDTAELNSKQMFKCAICEFLAQFTSVLHDHYIAEHKVENKIACSVCFLKFENTQGFLDHFADHASGKIPSSVAAMTQKVEAVQPPVVEKKPSTEPVSLEKYDTEKLVKNMSGVEVINPTNNETNCVKIPYQSTLHDRKNENKLKKFEELKSYVDLSAMKKPEKLKHLYKCSQYNCSFTSDVAKDFVSHLANEHSGKRTHCCYCLEESYSPEKLAQHVNSKHGKRRYQCSVCFYRAYSKIHIQLHAAHLHQDQTDLEILECETDESAPEETDALPLQSALSTTWPYQCAVGNCDYQCFDPKDFKTHTFNVHRSVTVLYCHYCKVECLNFKRLINHYRLHGINTFQCNYCINGTETKDEILMHIVNVHPDRPMMAYLRGSEEDATNAATSFPVSTSQEEPSSTSKSSIDDPPSVPDDLTPTKTIDFEPILYEVIGQIYYPRHVMNLSTDLVCGVSYCGQQTESMVEYLKHLREDHGAANYPCPHCPSMSDSWPSLKQHLKCHGPELYACSHMMCDYHDADRRVVRDHLKTHSDVAAKVVIIRDVDAAEPNTINNLEDLKPKTNECPKVVDKAYQCYFCGFKTDSLKAMKNHLFSELRYQRFACDICLEKCTSRADIRKHFETKHSDEDIKFSISPNFELEHLVKKSLELSGSITLKNCFSCKKSFKNSEKCHRHESLCALQFYQPYDCEYCSVSASDLLLLKFHIEENHFPKPIAFAEISSAAVAEEIDKRLQTLRLKYITDAFPAVEKNANTQVKYYVCSGCSYESDHKKNVANHIKEFHKDAMVAKRQREHIPSSQVDVKPVINEDATSATTKTGDKKYRCNFCIKRLHQLQDLINHVESCHNIGNDTKYAYYYSPDPTDATVMQGTEEYDCAFCNYEKNSLRGLKTHYTLMHAESNFKVRGWVQCTVSKSVNVGCGYCYARMDGTGSLKRHFKSEHPNLAHKIIEGFREKTAKKRANELDDGPPNKRIKFTQSVFVCSHCGAAFATQKEIDYHSKRSHTRQLPKYACRYIGPTSGWDRSYYKCEFCAFVGEMQHLESHCDSKHKNRVTCGHCGRRFEFATKLRAHHDVAHPNLEIKYKQETIGFKGGHQSEDSQDGLGKAFVMYKGAKMTINNFSRKVNIRPSVVLDKIK